jgi:hypothetical protein
MPKLENKTDKHYKLTINEAQANTIKTACELLARVHMGQLAFVAEVSLPWVAGTTEAYLELKDALQNLEPLATGLNKNSFHGIHSSKLPEQASIAWDLHQVIRHRVSHDRADMENTPKDFQHRMTVDYDTPLKSSKNCQLANIEACQTPKCETTKCAPKKTKRSHR